MTEIQDNEEFILFRTQKLFDFITEHIEELKGLPLETREFLCDLGRKFLEEKTRIFTVDEFADEFVGCQSEARKALVAKLAQKPVKTQRKESTRLRFSILERDRFTCQYCGRSAPEVSLHVDHIIPLSKGGTDTAENLITACAQCNRGKANVGFPCLVSKIQQLKSELLPEK